MGKGYGESGEREGGGGGESEKGKRDRSVTISGTAVEDGVLTAVSTLLDEDELGAITYTWRIGASPVPTTLCPSHVASSITVTSS